MKNTGIVRKLDELGRIVIPKEIRDNFEMKEGTELDISVKGNKIILEKHKDTFCPRCLKRCEYTDNFCSRCGLEFKTLIERARKNGKTGILIEDEIEP